MWIRIGFNTGPGSSILGQSGYGSVSSSVFTILQFEKIQFIKQEQMQYTCPYVSMKDVQATGEASLFWRVLFALLDPDPAELNHAYPDPHHLP